MNKMKFDEIGDQIIDSDLTEALHASHSKWSDAGRS